MARDPHALPSVVEPALNEAEAFLRRTLEALLPKPAGPEARLLAAMRHAAPSAGRGLRAFLVLQTGGLFGVDERPLGRVVAAAECVYAGALAHSALPAFSNGKALHTKDNLHDAFDVATAILAGDALQALAFGLLGSADAIGDPFMRAELVQRLAQVAGHAGIAGGQMLETAFAAAPHGTLPPLPEISRLQRMKTAALMTYCCEAAATLGRASPPARHALSAYGQDVGQAFQIACDLEADDGEDIPMLTVVSALGAERARAQALALSAQAVRHLDLFGEKADLLRAAAKFVGGTAGGAAA